MYQEFRWWKSDTYLKIKDLIKKLDQLNILNILEISKLRIYPKLINYYLQSTLTNVHLEERGNLVQNVFFFFFWKWNN